MKKQRKNQKGITLIALVITIIVLLILAGVSISLVVGDNGIISRTIQTTIETDVSETKEKIKLEIMGSLDDTKIDYTNQDVIDAVNKITGHTVEENIDIIKSQKGNDVDISDLWIRSKMIQFTVDGKNYIAKEGETWEEWMKDEKNLVDASMELKFFSSYYHEPDDSIWGGRVLGSASSVGLYYDGFGYGDDFTPGAVVKYSDVIRENEEYHFDGA